MSRNGPALLVAPTLRRRGNDASGFGQAPRNLHQAFMQDDTQRTSSDRSDLSSNSPRSRRQTSELAAGDHGRRPPLTIQLPTYGTSSESSLRQDPRHLAQLSPLHARAPLVHRPTKSVSQASHPACLTPGHRATSHDAEEARRIEVEANRASASLATIVARFSDAESPTLNLAARQLFQQAVPPGFNTNANTSTVFAGFGSSDSQASNATVAESFSTRSSHSGAAALALGIYK